MPGRVFFDQPCRFSAHIAVIEKKPGIDIVVQVDQKFVVILKDFKLNLLGGEFLVLRARSSSPDLEMDVFLWDFQELSTDVWNSLGLSFRGSSLKVLQEE